MRAIVTDKNTLQSLSPYKIETYLSANGWKEKHKQQNIVAIWEYNGSEIAVPFNQKFADYTLRISELLELLEKAENRSQLEIIKDLFAVHSDVLRIHAESPSYEDGTIPILRGVELVNHGQQMILASANSTLKKQAIYRGKSPETVRQYLDDVRLGQTEHGSFVATFYSPIPTNEPSFPGLSSEPYERQVIENLVHSLNSVQDAAEEYYKSDKIACFKDAINDGVNYNLCEAILGIASAAPASSVHISVSWSPLIPSDTSRNVIIPQKVIPAVLKASEYYKYLNIPEDVTIEGYVIGLSKEKAKQMTEGTVRILANIDGTLRRVRINLSESSHHLAVHAYEEGAKVICSGKLIKDGKFWHLDNPSELKSEKDFED